jgi:hypothetical protein
MSHYTQAKILEQVSCLACFWPLYKGQEALCKEINGKLEFFCSSACHQRAEDPDFFPGSVNLPTEVS